MAKMRAGLVALAFLGWCGFAHALALGEIQVHSRLNQVLTAEIPLSLSNPGEADDLIVELASNEEFDRHGIERAEFLSALRFTVDGNAIKVTSKQIAREPFITFLLNVRWSGGRLVREYTVLLDPAPTTAPSSGISKSQASTTEAVTAATPASAPASKAEAAPKTESAPAKPAATEKIEAPAAAAPAAPTAGTSAGGTYGPVSPKETLWSIAYKLRPDPSLTMDQVQIAFVNANPKAFEGGKVSGLKKGSILRVPTADEIRAVDPANAKAEVAAARNAPTPIAHAEAPAQAAKSEPTAKAETMPAPAPAEAAPAPAAAAKPKPKPESAPASKTAEVAPQAVTPPPQAVTPPPQPAAVPPPAQAPPDAAQAPKQAPAAESAAAPSQAPAPEAKPAPTETKPAPASAPEKKPATATAHKTPAPDNDLVSTVLGTVKDLADNDMARYGIAGLIGLLILVPVGRRVGAVIAKARYERAARKEAPQSAPMVGDTDVTQVAEGPSTQQLLEATAGADAATVVTATHARATSPVMATQVLGDTMQQTVQQTQVVEPSMATSGKVDFDVTGTFADQTVQIKLDAGDPVSEAEFHRAYGLYDEAALLLKQALEKDPKRTDARIKLAEIYFEASKANEFIEVAKVLKGQVPEAEWQKIALLGTQIAPNNELFSGAAGGGSVDISFDEPPTAAAPAAAPASAPAADSGLEFKLEDVQLDAPRAAPAAAPSAAPADTGLEFDLGGLTLDTPAAAAPTQTSPTASAPAADAGLDLGNFDLDVTGAAPAADLGGELSVGDVAAAGDESSTKLDLARAYIDMGDNDMAKSLLNEVAQQGNDHQKKEAQDLLKRVPA